MTRSRFINALPEGDRGEAALIGIPFDGFSPLRSGANSAPDAIRNGSASIETFSAFLDRDLAGRDYVDWGNIDFQSVATADVLSTIEKKIDSITAAGMDVVALGGEHCQTIAIVKSLLKDYPDLCVLQLDAHLNFQDVEDGEALCHATVMRRVAELIAPERIHRLGVRSGSKDEFQSAGVKLPLDIDSQYRDVEGIVMSIPRNAHLFVSLDMDVFDPSLVPGVLNPVPWGLTWREFIQVARALTYFKCVGFEVVELIPGIDSTGVSSVVAASAVRELMLSLMP